MENFDEEVLAALARNPTALANIIRDNFSLSVSTDREWGDGDSRYVRVKLVTGYGRDGATILEGSACIG